jgi:hypothetical protein
MARRAAAAYRGQQFVMLSLHTWRAVFLTLCILQVKQRRCVGDMARVLVGSSGLVYCVTQIASALPFC